MKMEQIPVHRGHRLGALLRHWHRRTGIFAGIFLLWLAFTGLLINESQTLGLGEARIDWAWLMYWYGLKGEPPQTGFTAAGHWLVPVGEETLLDGAPLTPLVPVPQGLAAAGGLLYLATPRSLVLLKPDGTRVEELRAPPLPVSTIRRIGTLSGAGGDRVAIQDLDAYASEDGEDWQPVSPDAVRWSRPEPLPQEQQQRAAPYARPTLPLERVLADAHSGRLFGRHGPLLIDLTACSAVLLVCSGLWMVWRASRRRPHPLQP